MKEGLVSIITPCYNGSKYIAETIDSVLEQTYTFWEMIIVDDGSKDNSAEIIETYCKKDSRIRLIKQANGGSANARNHGIREADGQYIVLLDADDLWYKDFLTEQIQFMKTKKASLVYGSYDRINEKSEKILKPYICKKYITYKDMLWTNYVGCLTGVYDISQYGKVYLREELKSVRDDYAYWLDIIKLCGSAYGNQKVLASYRVMQSTTTGNKKKLIKKHYSFYRNYLKMNIINSVIHTLYWGLLGVIKFSR